MSRTIVAVRKARKRHTCGRCGRAIQPGELYEDRRLPPGDDTVGNTVWLRSPAHIESCTR